LIFLLNKLFLFSLKKVNLLDLHQSLFSSDPCCGFGCGAVCRCLILKWYRDPGALSRHSITGDQRRQIRTISAGTMKALELVLEKD
jgi:hypothetical protein